ncbi:hypothetical protein [Halomicrococcus sp. NG-SE-24]|uniref:hypothetical protein n=1 Tax=Halomicrococcus sp. NG-SE-24 TaxID=3436928 RepID=UPI003D985463
MVAAGRFALDARSLKNRPEHCGRSGTFDRCQRPYMVVEMRRVDGTLADDGDEYA